MREASESEMEEEREMIRARLKPFTTRQRREHKAIPADLKEMQALTKQFLRLDERVIARIRGEDPLARASAALMIASEVTVAPVTASTPLTPTST